MTVDIYISSGIGVNFKLLVDVKGRRGLAVIISAYGAKGRRLESRSFLFFEAQ